MERRLVEQIHVYYDLHVPPGYNRRQKWPLLIALHGYSGNKESMMRLAKRINDQHWLIASLQGPYRLIIPPSDTSQEMKTGFGWATPYKHEDSVALHHQSLFDLIEDVSKEYRVDSQRLFLMGFSQAVALNYRFIFTHPDVIRGIIGVCGGIPGDYQEKSYQRTSADVLHIAAEQDEFYNLDRVKGFVPLLQQRARSVELKVYHANHVFPHRSLSYINRWIGQRI
jgi:phospholipase/carboxylesterase